MLSALRWLALEVKYLDRARAFYDAHLSLPVRRETDREVALAAGDVDLVLRRPVAVPRGGVHVHYALSTGANAYDDWWDRLSADLDLAEHDFGGMRSLYFDDPDDHCVEIGGTDDAGEGITGLFEVAVEVADLERAVAFYRTLGFEPVDYGEERRRVRLSGPVALELWEPQLGIADARGGVHVDLGFAAPDPAAAAERVADAACETSTVDSGVRVLDPDGHVLTLVGE